MDPGMPSELMVALGIKNRYPVPGYRKPGNPTFALLPAGLAAEGGQAGLILNF